MAPTVQYLIVDSGPFIKGVPLQDWSNNIITIRDVIGEIRDQATRQRLQVLPYTLTFREPSNEAIKLVTDFSKKTGDYVSLSPVDIRLLALTYQLECENGPSKGSQLRMVPFSKGESPLSNDVVSPSSLSTVGFYKGNATRSRTTSSSSSSCCQTDIIDITSKLNINSEEEGEERRQGDKETQDSSNGILQELSSNEDNRVNGLLYCENETLNNKEFISEEVQEESIESEGEGDNEDWITPDNFQQVCDKMGGAMESSAAGITVGCMTTDYAMQNVLLQMGLHVLSVEGMLIKRLQTYALQCKACFKTSFKKGLITCPSCGNRTLIKVLATANEEGLTQYIPLSHKQFSHKGLRYSVPLPKGGRQSNVSQLVPGQRDTFKLPRSRTRPNPLDPDYSAGQDSPFRFKDVTSRGAQIAFRSRGGRGQVGGGSWHHNPNKVGKRKK